jgi:hypothetical protein
MEAEKLASAHAGNFNPTPFGVILAKLEKKHTDTISSLVEIVRNLQIELVSLKSQVAALDSVVDVVMPEPPSAPAAAPPPAPKAPQQPPPPPPPAPPAAAPSWATVTRRARKKKTATIQTAAGVVPLFHVNTNRNIETYPQYLARMNASAPKASPPKKQQPTTIPLRPRRLLVKRDGTELTSTPMQLRDALNKVLGFTAILSAQISRGSSGACTGNVSLTLMENLLATKLYAKVGEHLNTIPGALSLHLDSPIVQMVVHGIPTSLPLELLQQELTTYNSGLTLATVPRWLTKPDQRKEKKASSVVIALSGNRAQEVAARPRLFAFSATLRCERKLRFGPSTQCANCQLFGHHTTKCTNAAACRWCAGTHLTGAHSCPTSTCSTNGRPCAHTLAKCAVCLGPHESHFKDCTLRVSSVAGEEMDENL